MTPLEKLRKEAEDLAALANQSHLSNADLARAKSKSAVVGQLTEDVANNR